MLLNLRQIEVFRAIMVTGSISGAARLLTVSQPAISRIAAHIEDRLRVKLFERLKGRLQPTPEAHRLFKEVDEVHQSVLKFNHLAEELRDYSIGALHIAASPSVAQVLVPEAIKRFREQQTKTRITFEVLPLYDILAKVNTNQADFGVSVLPVNELDVDCTPIMDGLLKVICPYDHPLAKRQKIDVDDLPDYPLISYSPETPYGSIVEQALAKASQPVTINTTVRFTSVAASLVQAEAGLAIADNFVTKGDTWPNVASRPLTPTAPMHAYLITQKIKPLSNISNVFIKILKHL